MDYRIINTMIPFVRVVLAYFRGVLTWMHNTLDRACLIKAKINVLLRILYT